MLIFHCYVSSPEGNLGCWHSCLPWWSGCFSLALSLAELFEKAMEREMLVNASVTKIWGLVKIEGPKTQGVIDFGWFWIVYKLLAYPIRYPILARLAHITHIHMEKYLPGSRLILFWEEWYPDDILHLRGWEQDRSSIRYRVSKVYLPK